MISTNFNGQTQFQPYQPTQFQPFGGTPATNSLPPQAGLALISELFDVVNVLFDAFSGFVGGPQPGFGGPQPGFGGPQPGFGGPQPGFGGPQPGYGGPQPGYGGPQPGNGQAPAAPQVDGQSVNQVSQNFERYDLNDDGVLSSNELGLQAQLLARDGVQDHEKNLYETLTQLGEHNPELMFLTIQQGDAAWFGLSQQDLGALQGRLEAGEGLDSISQQVQHQVLRDRNISYNRLTTPEEAFHRYVEEQRQRVLG